MYASRPFDDESSQSGLLDRTTGVRGARFWERISVGGRRRPVVVDDPGACILPGPASGRGTFLHRGCRRSRMGDNPGGFVCVWDDADGTGGDGGQRSPVTPRFPYADRLGGHGLFKHVRD